MQSIPHQALARDSFSIHGARAVVKYCKGKTDPLSRWLQGLVERRGFNKAAVAMA